MWFDVQQAMATLVGGELPSATPAPATIATVATKPSAARPLVAVVAGVAALNLQIQTSAEVIAFPLPSDATDSPTPAYSRQNMQDFPHGVGAIGGQPRTWTGRIVSLDEWRKLSVWDRHGSTGQKWNGLTWQWEPDGGPS